MRISDKWLEIVELVRLSGRPRLDVFYYPKNYGFTGYRDLIIVDENEVEIDSLMPTRYCLMMDNLLADFRAAIKAPPGAPPTP